MKCTSFKIRHCKTLSPFGVVISLHQNLLLPLFVIGNFRKISVVILSTGYPMWTIFIGGHCVTVSLFMHCTFQINHATFRAIRKCQLSGLFIVFLQIYNTTCGTHVSSKCTFSQMCSLVLQVHQLHCHLCFQDDHQQESSLNYNPETVHITPYASF